jgi:transcriptional regulator GlxA family with amidase domain
MKKKVGILLFDEVEVLDFAGPFEVFSLAEVEGGKAYECFTVSQRGGLTRARNGLKVEASHTFDDCPDLDLLIVPGGYGAEKIEVDNPVLLDWLRLQSAKVGILASICTGAFLLAKAGIVGKERVTTHWMDLDELQRQYPDLKVIRDVKFIDNGKIMTSAGISAGIELSLHIVGKQCGVETAVKTAKRMEYDYRPV